MYDYLQEENSLHVDKQGKSIPRRDESMYKGIEVLS